MPQKILDLDEYAATIYAAAKREGKTLHEAAQFFSTGVDSITAVGFIFYNELVENDKVLVPAARYTLYVELKKRMEAIEQETGDV